MFAFAALLLAHAPASLTVSYPPLRLADAVARISAAGAGPLRVAPALRSEVLFVRLKDAPVETALTRIAELFDAKWETSETGLRTLVPDTKARDRSRQVAAARDRDDWRGSLAYLRKTLAAQPAELDEAFVKATLTRAAAEEARQKRAMERGDYASALTMSAVGEESPGWRLLARLMPLIDEKTLFSMPYRSRLVFAERPTAMQTGAPLSWSSPLAQYRREVGLLKKEPIAKVRIVVSRWESGGRYSAQLAAVGADGTVVDQAAIRMANDNEILKKPGGHTFVPPAAKKGEAPLALSSDAVEIRSIVRQSVKLEREERERLMRKWKPVLMDPVAHEPLFWFPGQGYLAAAEAEGKNLIGSVDEQGIGRYEKIIPDERPSQFLARHSGAISTSPEGWMIVKPEELSGRYDRAEARSMIQDSVRRGGLPLDEAAAWAARYPGSYPFTNWVADCLLTLLPSNGPNSLLKTILDVDGLRLWDALGPGAREDLRNGRTLDVARLSSAAQRELAEEVYWYDALGESVEPTEILPNGISGGSVSLEINETPIVSSWAESAGEPTHDMPLTAEQFGSSLAKGSNYWGLPATDFQKRNRFRLGVSRGYTLHFMLEPGRRPMDVTLQEIEMDTTSTPLTALPPEFQKRVEAARAAVKPDAPEIGKSPPP